MRSSPMRGTPKHKPPAAPPHSLPALTAPAPLHLSSAILRKISRSVTYKEDSEKKSDYLWLLRTRMPVFRRQDILRQAVFLSGGKVDIWKQALELFIMSEPKSTAPPLILPAEKNTRGYFPLGLMRTSLRSRLSRMPHGRHIKEERKEIRIGNFSLGGSSHQTGDAAFTPATPQDLHHSRANNDSHN